MFNLTRLLKSYVGQVFVSLMLGLGLATMFRKACHDGTCIEFNGPVIDEVSGKTYKFGEYCYKYSLEPTKCDPLRKTVELDDTEAKVLQKEQSDKKSDSWLPFSM